MSYESRLKNQDIDELFDEKIYLNSGKVERVEKND